jgi:hypothetical protein
MRVKFFSQPQTFSNMKNFSFFIFCALFFFILFIFLDGVILTYNYYSGKIGPEYINQMASEYTQELDEHAAFIVLSNIYRLE